MQGSPQLAFDYFSAGAHMVARPGLRRFVLVPILVNVIIFIALTAALFSLFGDAINTVQSWLPSWLNFLTWLLWPVMYFLFFVVYGYSFNIITNIIGGPFYGILAEKVEEHLCGQAPNGEPLSELIPRTLRRELVKLWYFVSRGFLVFLLFAALFFIPGANLIGAGIGAIWSCWCMAAQYMDYPADNHQLSFREMRRRLNKQPLTSYSFGGIILLGSMVPFVNIFVTPIAVAGATIYWTREVKNL